MNNIVSHKNIIQMFINVMTLMFFAVLVVTPALIAYGAYMYLNNIGGLIFLAGYWCVYDIFIAYFKNF